MEGSAWLSLGGGGALMIALVVLSGAFSGSETALFSLTRLQLRENADSRNQLRRLAAQLMERPKQTLLVILIANTTVNVLLFASSYVTFRGLEGAFGAWVTPIGGVVAMLLVVVCGEVVPKVVAASAANTVAPYAATLVKLLSYLLGPVGRVLGLLLVDPISRLILGRHAERAAGPPQLSTDELKALLQVSRREGVIRPYENDLLREVIDLGHMKVRDVMVPRVEVKAWEVNQPPDGLRDLMRESKLKKIPVYEGSIDNVIGLIYAKILFLEPDTKLRDAIMPVHFVPEVANCERLLRHFRDNKSQLAIAVDEYGGMAGLVTLEDILEEIVGDIRDRDDPPPEPEITQLSDREYEISGRLSVRYWSQVFGVSAADRWTATVGGLITSRLGRPACVGDTQRFGNVELTVTHVQGRRVERLRLRLVRDDEPAGGTSA